MSTYFIDASEITGVIELFLKNKPQKQGEANFTCFINTFSVLQLLKIDVKDFRRKTS